MDWRQRSAALDVFGRGLVTLVVRFNEWQYCC